MCHPGLIRAVHRHLAGSSTPVSRRSATRIALGVASTGLGLATTTAPTGLAAGQGRGASREIRFDSVVDLTHPLSPDFPVYPGYTPFSAAVTATLENPGTRSRVVAFEEHIGTHVDAPSHFIADGADVSSIPVEQLVAPLVVLDLRARVVGDADATVQVDDLLEWESSNGRIPDGAFVAMYSSWDDRAGDAVEYLNADDSGVLHFPAWGPRAAGFLVAERDVVGLGVDTISLDNPTSPFFEAHRALLGAGGYAVENLAGLGNVPAAGATVVIGAPTFAGGSGGAARVLALA